MRRGSAVPVSVESHTSTSAAGYGSSRLIFRRLERPLSERYSLPACHCELMTDATRSFHTLVADLDYPMFVVTAVAAGERSGCLVGFLSQASIDPPRLLVFLSKANRTYSVAQHAEILAVNFLHEGSRDLAACSGSTRATR